MRILDTENNPKQPCWVAINDIANRAASAADRHAELFDDPDHGALADTVQSVMQRRVKLYNAAYQTARAQTKNQPAHTQVKLDRVEFTAGSRVKLVDELMAMGIAYDDIQYMPSSMSISVRVKGC